ncbi:MAG: flagellar basal body-associated FliL family protein [Rhodospirillales bacterium]|nr:flagellar basal body-associated FliL family protein [Alphaproteobacteria bacterium]USO06062.1 MAG: flagellar basal body-associated FliL family protein [Rhodospirillales bacterium]
MRMIFIALGALIVLGGGGAGAYFYFFQPAEASAVDTVDDHKEEDKKKDDHSGHYEFVELDPLILPIVDNNGVSQTVNLVVTLEVVDAKARAKVEMITPRLKDAFIQDMYGVLNKHAALKGGVIQVDILKKRLNAVSARVVGEDTVHDVLLQVVQQRPI